MRHLASIREIKALEPIEGADFIETAVIDGWRVIVKKGDFAVGDPITYFEIDSVLPECPEYEFLRKRCYFANELMSGFRIKTMKMKGVVSQGLVLPSTGDPVGTDVTEQLGVLLFEGPAGFRGADYKAAFPYFIPKTDQERVQNLKDIPAGTYEATQKYDGASITIYYKDGQLGVCSRNRELTFGDHAYYNAAKHILAALEKYGENIAVQAELMGPGIQGNKLKLKDHEVYVFDVFDIDSQTYLNPFDRFLVVDQLSSYGKKIKEVPYIRDFNLAYSDTLIDNILEWTDNYCTPIGAEGVVFKAYDSQFSFKAISNNYLLKEK